MQKAMSFNNISITYVNGNIYRINFWYTSKNDAINIMIDKTGVLSSFLLYINI